MGDDIDEVIVRVRADTTAFARDVATMRGELEGPLASGVARAGRMIESALARAISSGTFGFDDLKRVALRALGEIAAASLRTLLTPAGGQGTGTGLGSIVTSLITGLLGAPGRATGGPVSAGRAYLVGERGPELFVPPGEGRIVSGRGGRDVKVAITIHTPTPGDPQLLQKSGRQIARAVRSALRDGQ